MTSQRITLRCLALFLTTLVFTTPDVARADHESSTGQPAVLADYSEFPRAWKSHTKLPAIEEIYSVQEDETGRYLEAKVGSRPQRVFKKFEWNPWTHPVVTWRWRLHVMPREKEANIAVYVSLGTDFIGVPKIIKYLWSNTLPEGTERNQGFFRPYEVVVQSGSAPLGEWITERVEATRDFQRLFGDDPDELTYGIGFLVGPGIEIDISPVAALPED